MQVDQVEDPPAGGDEPSRRRARRSQPTEGSSPKVNPESEATRDCAGYAVMQGGAINPGFGANTYLYSP
jgi:hypothetical protein